MNRCTLNGRRVEGYGRLLSTAGEELRDEVCGVGFLRRGWFWCWNLIDRDLTSQKSDIELTILSMSSLVSNLVFEGDNIYCCQSCIGITESKVERSKRDVLGCERSREMRE